MRDEFKEKAETLVDKWNRIRKLQPTLRDDDFNSIIPFLDALVAAMPDPRDELLDAVRLLLDRGAIYDATGTEVVGCKPTPWMNLRSAYFKYTGENPYESDPRDELYEAAAAYLDVVCNGVCREWKRLHDAVEVYKQSQGADK